VRIISDSSGRARDDIYASFSGSRSGRRGADPRRRVRSSSNGPSPKLTNSVIGNQNMAMSIAYAAIRFRHTWRSTPALTVAVKLDSFNPVERDARSIAAPRTWRRQSCQPNLERAFNLPGATAFGQKIYREPCGSERYTIKFAEPPFSDRSPLARLVRNLVARDKTARRT
jgi:hypothetical protein